MTTPQRLEAAPAYEHAHLIARDLLADIRRMLDQAITPDDAALAWQHARAMNRVNAQLSDVADALDSLNNTAD